MPLPPPPYRQRKSDSCAVACLRMILAQHGIAVDEVTLERQVAKQPGGVHIEDLADLARAFHFTVEILPLALKSISSLLKRGVYPIVYLNRAHFELRFPSARKVALRRCIVHSVIPVAIRRTSVVVNDPRIGRRKRVSKRRFEAARRDLSFWSVVCRPLET